MYCKQLVKFFEHLFGEQATLQMTIKPIFFPSTIPIYYKYSPFYWLNSTRKFRSKVYDHKNSCFYKELHTTLTPWCILMDASQFTFTPNCLLLILTNILITACTCAYSRTVHTASKDEQGIKWYRMEQFGKQHTELSKKNYYSYFDTAICCKEICIKCSVKKKIITALW